MLLAQDDGTRPPEEEETAERAGPACQPFDHSTRAREGAPAVCSYGNDLPITNPLLCREKPDTDGALSLLGVSSKATSPSSRRETANDRLVRNNLRC